MTDSRNTHNTDSASRFQRKTVENLPAGRWIEVARTFTPPVSAVKHIRTDSGPTDVNVNHLLMGVTVIEYRDAKGRRAPKFVELSGDHRPTATQS
jgi:hypothetical protein